MKKIFTLITCLVLGATAYAQQNYAFCDKDGTVITNGSTITCTEAEDDGFSVQIKSGLYVKNVGAPDNYQVSVKCNITKIDNGSVQLCFPNNCYNYDAVGEHGSDDKIALTQGTVKDIMTEWFPTAYGECTVTYTARVYQSVFEKETVSVTVTYKYQDPAGISEVGGLSAQPVASYDLLGRRLSGSQTGLRLVRMSDGSLRKVINK